MDSRRQGIYNAEINSILGLIAGFILSVIGAYIIHDQHEYDSSDINEGESEVLLDTENEEEKDK